MGILIICLVIIIISMIVSHYAFDDDYSLTIGCFFVALFVGLPLSLGLNGDFVNQELVETVEIGVLSNVEKDENAEYKFLSRKTDGTVSYIKIVDNEWEVSEIPNNTMIVIIENENVLYPSLSIYQTGYKSNFWTFSLMQMSETYVFRLPKTVNLPILEKVE